jgi:nucleotide-binding universal stress UspA family protein
MKILFATDGSDDARNAGRWIPHLPIASDCDVMVVTVLEPALVVGVPEQATDVRSLLLTDARRLADETASELLAVCSATGRVVEGDARDEIVAAATSWGADLIVVGARGLGAIKEFLLGSVSLDVARHAPVPVLVAKGRPRRIENVTVALDGSVHAQRALDWLLALPAVRELTVRLLGVAEPQRFPSTAPGVIRGALRAAVDAVDAERCAAALRILSDAAEGLHERVKRVEIAVATGAPADAIVRHSAAHGADLLVVGARGAGAVSRLLLGSVSESVLRHAECPVLVVPSASGRSA